MVLTTMPVVDELLLDLPAIPWSAHHVVLDSPLGRLDLVTTHLASGANNPRCVDADCAPPCRDDDDVRLCGARMILEHLRTAGGDGLWVVTGDLNAEPAEPAHRLFLDAGFSDAYAAAGHPECAPEQRRGCTGGRGEVDLDDPTALPTERIDYILVRSSGECAVSFDPADVDAWAAAPVPPVGESRVVWASDHAGVLARLRCT
jgi:endonuclease/exonuclease/phosphatase family metal-dependent hydrolase